MRLRLGKIDFAGWVGSCCHGNSRVGFNIQSQKLQTTNVPFKYTFTLATFLQVLKMWLFISDRPTAIL